LSRFARLLPQLLTQDARPLERADLRYTNGFALSWKPVRNAEPGTLDPAAGLLQFPRFPATGYRRPATTSQQADT
jgi:hypothetical protein